MNKISLVGWTLNASMEWMKWRSINSPMMTMPPIWKTKPDDQFNYKKVRITIEEL